MSNNHQQYDGNTIAGFICGLISCLTFWYKGATIVSLILGIVGLWLTLNARKRSTGALTTAGFVLSICGTVLSAICLFTLTLCSCGLYAGLGCLTCLAL